MKIGFIGLGNMASAMMGGMIKKGIVPKENIVGYDVFPKARENAEGTYGIKLAESNFEVVENSDILFLAVKPQFYETVIKEIKDTTRDEQVVVSIAPGKTTAWLGDLFEKDVKIVRCMPNTPALVLEGCTGVCQNALVTEDEMKQVLELLQSFSLARLVPEHLMDTVVGVSGSSPAYVFMMIEAMADAAVADGMPRAQAYEFAAQAVYGSAKMVLETKKHPGELKDMVCSPGGTTIQAVKVLEEKGFRSAIMEAQCACVSKSKSL